MKLFNVELLKDKNYEDGAALLIEAGYSEGDTACDTDVPGYVFYDYYYYLSDEDGDIIDTITYEVTCDADEFINDDDDQGAYDEEYHDGYKILKIKWYRLESI